MRTSTAIIRWPAFLLLLLCAGWAQGQTYLYVSPNGSASGLTPQSPTDLQSALDYARTDGAANIIYLSTGVYDASTATFKLDSAQHDNKDISIVGGYNTDYSHYQQDPSLTIWDGGTTRQIFRLNGMTGLNYNFELENITFKDGYDLSFGGAAAALISGSPGNWGPIDVTIKHVNFLNNRAGEPANQRSGGALLTNTHVALIDCYFYNNSAASGGAVYASVMPDASLPTYKVIGCTFDSNSAYSWTGHIINNRGDLEMRHCTLIGTGIHHKQPGAALANQSNSIGHFYHNTFSDMHGLNWGVAIDYWNCDGVVANNTFYDMTMGHAGSGHGAISYYHANNTVTRKLYITNNTFYDIGRGTKTGNAVVYRGNNNDSIWVYNNLIYNTPALGGNYLSIFNMDYWAGGIMLMHSNLSLGLLPGAGSGYVDLGGNQSYIDAEIVSGSTVALASTSPAIDAGTASAPYLPGEDIRGAVRHLGSYPDIGAYEFSHPPTAVQLNGTTVDENVPIGTLVGKFTTTDPDIGDRFTYQFTGAGDYDYFAIVADSLVTAKAIDYEGVFELEFFVRSKDSGGDTVSARITVEITDVNEPGFVANPIPDQTATVNELWLYTVPANTFEDPDLTDKFVPESYLADGNLLPGWLSFDPDGVAFSGTPTQTGTWDIVVKMTDNGNHVVTDTFTLTVQGGSSIDELAAAGISVYPNPAQQWLCMESIQPIEQVRVNSVSGQWIITPVTRGNSGQYWINTGAWPAGIYFLQLRTSSHTIITTIIKQ